MISIKDLENLANLARIDIDEKSKESLVKEFDSILDYVDQLKKANVQIDTEGRVGAVRNVVRPDVAVDGTNDMKERLLGVAPQREGDFVAVKKMIEQ